MTKLVIYGCLNSLWYFIYLTQRFPNAGGDRDDTQIDNQPNAWQFLTHFGAFRSDPLVLVRNAVFMSSVKS